MKTEHSKQPAPPPATEQDDADEWARRERQYRKAWLEGPSEEEKSQWARRERERQRSGCRAEYGYPAVSPTDQDVADWAETEARRRKAWLAGPTSREKEEWARANQRHRSREQGQSALPPTDSEMEEWAVREQERRQAWLEGPTAEDKREWSRLVRNRCSTDSLHYPYSDEFGRRSRYSEETKETMYRVQRDAEFAAGGLYEWLTDWPYEFWGRLVDAGRRREERFSVPLRRRRIDYYE